MALAVASLAVPFVALAAADPKAARFYEDALSRFEQKDFKGASIQLKNALQVDKNMLSVHLLLGRVLLADGQPGQAEIAFGDALRLGVNRAELISELAQSLVDQGKQPTLLTDERFSTDGLPPGVQARLMLQKSAAAADIGNLREAFRLVAQARELNPGDPDGWLAEVALRVRQRQFEQAVAAADKALALGGPTANALYQRAQIDHVAGRLEPAIAGYGRALQADAAHIESLLARAGLLIDLNRLDDARRDVDAVRRAAAADPRGAFLGALLAEKAGDAAAARTALKSVTSLVDPVPMDFLKYKAQVLMLNGLAHYGLGERESAKPYLEAYQKLDPGGGVSKLLAQILLSEGNTSAAISALESYLRVHPGDSQAQALLASAHMSEGRPARAISVTREALKRQDTPELRTILGLSMLRSGQGADALAELEAVYRKDPGQQGAAATLVGLYLQQGQAKKALQVAQGLVKRAPGQAGYQTLLGQARLANGDKAGGRQAFDAAIKLNPALAGPQMALARLDSADGAHDAAVQRLTALLAQDERSVDIQFELAAAMERMGQPDEARRWLEKAVDHAGPRDHRPAIALIDLHTRYQRPEEALTVARSLAARMPSELQPQMALARVLLRQGDAEGARLALGTATRLANFDAPVQVEVAVLQMMAGNVQGAAYSLEKALSGQPGYLPAEAAMVDVEVRRGELTQAEARARRILQAHPKLALGHSLLGDVASARGAIPAASDAYQRAHRVEPSTDSLLRWQFALQRRDGTPAALALMKDWLKTRPQDRRVRTAMAGLLASTGDFTAARAQYEALLKDRPQDAAALNNLANVLLRVDPPAAVPVAERALAAAPGNPMVIDTLGWVLLRNGQNDRALQLLRDARLRNPADPAIRYHLAEALVKAGRTAEARTELTAALAGSPRFEGYKDAQSLLQSLP